MNGTYEIRDLDDCIAPRKNNAEDLRSRNERRPNIGPLSDKESRERKLSKCNQERPVKRGEYLGTSNSWLTL